MKCCNRATIAISFLRQFFPLPYVFLKIFFRVVTGMITAFDEFFWGGHFFYLFPIIAAVRPRFPLLVVFTRRHQPLALHPCAYSTVPCAHHHIFPSRFVAQRRSQTRRRPLPSSTVTFEDWRVKKIAVVSFRSSFR